MLATVLQLYVASLMNLTVQWKSVVGEGTGLGWALPESPAVLLQRPGSGPAIAAILRKLARGTTLPANPVFRSSERREEGFPVVLLFREGRAPLTVMLKPAATNGSPDSSPLKVRVTRV